jgi:hypothetical protein
MLYTVPQTVLSLVAPSLGGISMKNVKTETEIALRKCCTQHKREILVPQMSSTDIIECGGRVVGSASASAASRPICDGKQVNFPSANKIPTTHVRLSPSSQRLHTT